MYLHIGSNVQVPIKNIITILDIKILKNKYNNDFFNNVKKVVYTSSQEPKTVILVVNKYHEITLFISSISSYTLKKRLYLKQRK